MHQGRAEGAVQRAHQGEHGERVLGSRDEEEGEALHEAEGGDGRLGRTVDNELKAGEELGQEDEVVLAGGGLGEG